MLARVSVKRDDEGIWYIQAAIPGPALKVTDRYLVISWSPQALRDALRFIEPEKKAAGNESPAAPDRGLGRAGDAGQGPVRLTLAAKRDKYGIRKLLASCMPRGEFGHAPLAGRTR